MKKGDQSSSLKPDPRWQVLSSRVIYSAKPWVELSMQQISLPDGRVVDDYHQIKLPDYCVVYAETSEGMIIAARQYRHGVGKVCITLPAGLMEEGENPLAAMKRELLEETGYTAENWKSLGSYVPNSNYGCGKAHLFAARNARRVQEPSSLDLEESEAILLSANELLRALAEGEIVSLSMVAAVALATNPNVEMIESIRRTLQSSGACDTPSKENPGTPV